MDEESGGRGDQVVEFRRYRMVPDLRDELIDLFEREFIETQEAVGISVIGTFRVLSAPDRFFWLRSFADMASRKRALERFYDGPVWARHRTAANATMVDSDDNLLLRPAFADQGFLGLRPNHPPLGAVTESDHAVLGVVQYLAEPASPELLQQFGDHVAPAFEPAGLELISTLVTELAANDVPRLPIREGVQALVWFARASSHDVAEAFDRLKRHPEWRRFSSGVASASSMGQIEEWFLTPTGRSRLQG